MCILMGKISWLHCSWPTLYLCYTSFHLPALSACPHHHLSGTDCRREGVKWLREVESPTSVVVPCLVNLHLFLTSPTARFLLHPLPFPFRLTGCFFSPALYVVLFFYFVLYCALLCCFGVINDDDNVIFVVCGRLKARRPRTCR